jgi:NTE family protein
VRVEGFEPADTRRLTTLLARHATGDLNLDVLEADLAQILGLDRYEAVTWRMVRDDTGAAGLLIAGRLKPYAPPFMMLGLNLENTTSSDFNITATARYLTYGLVTSSSELRVDGTIGSNPSIGFQFYQPIGPTALFVAPYGGVLNESLNSIVDDQIVARYGVNTARLGLDVGVNLGRTSDVRVGAWVGHLDADVSVGDPLLPHLQGKETGAALVWRYDRQDSPVVPRGGVLASARLQRIFHGPDVVINDTSVPFDSRVTQLEVSGNQFWSFAERNRFFVGGGIGTSFDGNALPTNEFTLGAPLRLGAYRTGELRGDHYYLATSGYLRQIARLPDFLGGPVFAGGWVDQGDAFDDWSESTWRVNPGFGIVMDTLVGPVMVAGSAGFDGRWRTYIGIGRIFGR